MASVTKRGKTWQYTVSRYTDGKYDPVRKGGFKTKKEAQLAAIDVEMRLQKGANVLTRSHSFADYFENWIEKYKKDKHKNTYKRYKDSLNRVKEGLKDKPIQKISADDYQAFLNEYAAKRSKESVRKLHTHIRACVRDAIDDGYIAIDFTRKAQISGSVPPKRDSEKFIDFEESELLYDYLLTHCKTVSEHLILLALVSGMRFGELVGLTEEACDFEKNTVYIYQAWDYYRGTGFTDLKNTSSERTIPVGGKVMGKIKNLIDSYDKPISSEKTDFDSLVFKGDGKIKVVSNNAVNDCLRTILKKLGVQEITCHGLRHTHASVLLFSGFNVQYVSERLGHETIQTTLSTYSHILKELRAFENEKILSLYSKENGEENV